MKQMIMVVEDDNMIRNLIKFNLENNNFKVVEAADGEEAKDVFLTSHPCLIILDLMLPKVSGEEFFKWVRDRKGNEVSFIILSAKSRVSDKIKGLKMGADDYITKPFEPDELIAHVEAVLRRTGQFCEKIVHGGLCIKPRKGEVQLYDAKITLTKHEFNLLYYFMQYPNIIHDRETLIDHLYPYAEDSVLDRTIDAHIKKLRVKIEEDTRNPQRIQTVRGMGYKFVVS